MKKQLGKAVKTAVGLLQEMIYALLLTGVGMVIALSFAR